MPITKRVTARFNKRMRSSHSRAEVSPPAAIREESELREATAVRNLPIAVRPLTEARSEPVISHVESCALTHAPTPSSIRLSDYLRDARARAEEIIGDHPRHEGPNGTTCEPCLVAFPCDAVRAAEDVIAITARLRLAELVSSKALFEVMTELADLGAADTAHH
jgi:hypothetical protein